MLVFGTMTRLEASILVIVGVSLVIAPLGLGRRRGGTNSSDSGWLPAGLYFNRSDRRLLVPKRFGIGRTLNLAHPLAWLVIALPIAVALLVRAH